MVFDALRVGYDKHHALRKLYNRTGPYGSVKLDYKRPIESNYTASVTTVCCSATLRMSTE
jgi:hypothetical protein